MSEVQGDAAVGDGAVLNKILDTLERLVERVDKLENKVAGIGGLHAGVASRLASEDVGTSLVRVLDRLDQVEGTLNTLDTVSKKAPVLIEGAAHTADWVMNQAEDRGIDMFELGFRGLEIAEKAAKPEAIDAMSDLVDALPMASFAAGAGQTIVSAIEESGTDMQAMVGTTADLAVKATAVLNSPGFAKIMHAGLDPELLNNSADTVVRLLEAAQNPEVQRLLESGLLDGAALGTVGAATTALVETRKSGWDPVGMFGMLSVLGDKDVQRAVGFGAAVARRLGASLK